ncbi:MAG: methyltransferase [Muribaculaceae bacterium]|nr:methyltransferase [Muribaculaceae bacterium]
MQSVFRFKQFELKHGGSGMKLTTDSLLLGAWVRPDAPVQTIIDAGCGCGILALMCAQRFPDAGITAIDNNPGACDEADDNFRSSPWHSRLHTVCADINDWITSLESPVDMIICNPPYFTETLRSPDASRADARHAGSLSAAAIISIAGRILTPDGTLALVIPFDHLRQLSLPASLASLSFSRIAHIAAREGKTPSLALVQLSRRESHTPPEPELIDIRDASGYFTPAYQRLTHPFLLYDKKK